MPGTELVVGETKLGTKSWKLDRRGLLKEREKKFGPRAGRFFFFGGGGLKIAKSPTGQ